MGKSSFQKEDEDIGGSADCVSYEFKRKKKMGLKGYIGVDQRINRVS